MKRSIIGVSLAWLIIWQIVYYGIGSDLLFPSPIDTISALGHLAITKSFYWDVIATFYRVLVGIIISMAFGCITALMSYYMSWFEGFLTPLITALKVTPVMAIIISALLWFKSTHIPIFTSLLMCYPIVYTNALTGLKTVDKALLEMAQAFQEIGRAHV